MLRDETKRRARALQILYALELHADGSSDGAAKGLARLTGPEPSLLEPARVLVDGVLAHRDALDRLAESAADNWRLERIGTVERNILRIAIHELVEGRLPVPVIIDEALWLTQRFAGTKAPPFVNGVLDRVARNLGRL